MPERPQDITALLEVAQQGDSAAASRLLEVVYAELHRLASRYMSGERPDHTLQTTALVSEAYLRLFGSESHVPLKNSGHFFAIAATQMRRILVDHARQNNAQKRKVLIEGPFDEGGHIPVGNDHQLIALDDALRDLAEIDPDASKVVELRFFGGFTDKETAEILGKNVAKIRRDWEFARSWLYSRLDNTGR